MTAFPGHPLTCIPDVEVVVAGMCRAAFGSLGWQRACTAATQIKHKCLLRPLHLGQPD